MDVWLPDAILAAISDSIGSCVRGETTGSLRPGTDVNERGNYGETALHWAVLLGSDETVKLLLKLGADPAIEDMNHMTPQAIALLRQRRATSEIFRAHELERLKGWSK